MFSYGMRPRVTGAGGRDLTDPWCWKGAFYDTDYLYSAYGATQGDKLVQHWNEQPVRRWGYQTENLPEHKYVTGGQVKINRSGGNTIYETAIPRSEMPLFDPSKMNACRFNFVIINLEWASMIWCDRKGDMEPNMQYSRGYGVFDHWNKFMSSYGPSWDPFSPAQTRYAIEGGTSNAGQELPAQTPVVTNSGGVSVSSGLVSQAATGRTVAPIAARENVFNRKRN
jgi:hypothetical protein